MLVKSAPLAFAIGLRSITHCLDELVFSDVPPYRLMERLLLNLPIGSSVFAHDLLASCIKHGRLDRLRIWTLVYGIRWRTCDSCLATALATGPAMLAWVQNIADGEAHKCT